MVDFFLQMNAPIWHSMSKLKTNKQPLKVHDPCNSDRARFESATFVILTFLTYVNIIHLVRTA